MKRRGWSAHQTRNLVKDVINIYANSVGYAVVRRRWEHVCVSIIECKIIVAMKQLPQFNANKGIFCVKINYCSQ